MGAAGRDFNNFNIYFRKKDIHKVVAFRATRIPEIEERTYPPELARPNYPKGTPIYSEEKLLGKYDCTIEEREEYEPHIECVL